MTPNNGLNNIINIVKNDSDTASFSMPYIVLWAGINLLFLTDFPFMHTDEAWLAGLSRAMITERSPSAVEPFFDLIHRAPHAIKLLFHCGQALFIQILGYKLFSIRLFSLLTGAFSMAAFKELCDRLKLPGAVCALLLSVQIQFIYASHFGRQEIQLLLLMLLSLNAVYSSKTDVFKRGLLAGLPTAIAVGFHPNAFIIAWPAGLILLFEIIRKRRKIREGLGFMIPPALSSVFFVMLSLWFNRSFIFDYSSFGSEVGVFNPFDVKLLGFDDFYRKLFMQISGTYYTPNIIPVFIISAAALVFLIIMLIKARGKKHSDAFILSIAGIAGVNIGILLIGKYSAPSILFMIPFMIIMISTSVKYLKSGLRKTAYFIVLLALASNTVMQVSNEIRGRESYAEYKEQLEDLIPKGSGRVLGPLTAEFALDYDRLRDWRNLTALSNSGLNLEQYIKQADIKYIIYNEEYDLIYQNRPVWNILYGNPTVYHGQLQTFLAEDCSLLAEFSSPGYGTRIVLHRGKRDWFVRIYAVR